LSYIALWPPLDGDSYEYAGVASNFLKYGELVATHVSGYFLSDQTLPHPAWNRAGLWTFILVPFQALFGHSVWTFVVPYQMAVFLIGPVVYLVGARLFSRRVAFASAVATMLNPRIIAWSTQEDPGQPDTLALSLCLLVLYLFLNRRWFLAGVLSGVTVLTRVYGLVLFPVLMVWVCLFNRPALRSRGVYVWLLAAVVSCSPLLVRNFTRIRVRAVVPRVLRLWSSFPRATARSTSPLAMRRKETEKNRPKRIRLWIESGLLMP
jgi:4-amino-4-deoxy-L-arabinose transferase-like glycosyltransferase